ncbi:MAG: AAA family ATPase [Halobacteriales archaeon]
MNRAEGAPAFGELSMEELKGVLEGTDYVANDHILTTVLLSLKLGKPLLIEGEPGSGKTELGKVLADGFETELIRLQCYEGLTAESALYEWNYSKQLLTLQADEEPVADGDTVFDEEFLLKRPLLRALSSDGDTPPVLLIDEIDRADEEFEALLLEVLSDFQVSIPEYGTVTAEKPPIVVITSNRTRGLSDALKRRCVYLNIGPPSFEKEQEIVRRKVPELEDSLAAATVGIAQRLRREPLLKQPGAAETLDLARAVATLRENGDGPLTEADIEQALGVVLKESEDIAQLDDELMGDLLSAADEARQAGD